MANAFTLFGEIRVNTNQFNKALDDAQARLQRFKSTLDATEKASGGANAGRGMAAMAGYLQRLDDQNRKTTKSSNDLAESVKRTTTAIAASGVEAVKAASKYEDFGKKITSVGSAIKDAGQGLSLTVTAPLVLFGKNAFEAAKHIDELRAALFAATGSMDAANSKLQDLFMLSQQNAGVMLDFAAKTYGFLKPLGLAEEGIASMTTALGKLKVQGVQDPFTWIRNLVQIFQKGQLRDIKEAQTQFARFDTVLKTAFELPQKTGIDDLNDAIKKLRTEGVINLEQFIGIVSEAINMDEVLGKQIDPLGVRWEKTLQGMEFAMAKFGDAIARAGIPVVETLIALLLLTSKKFEALSPETQTATVAFGAFLAVLGPITLALGGIIWSLGKIWMVIKMVSSAVGGLRAFLIGLGDSAVVGGLSSLTAGLSGLIGPIIAIASGFGLIAKFLTMIPQMGKGVRVPGAAGPKAINELEGVDTLAFLKKGNQAGQALKDGIDQGSKGWVQEFLDEATKEWKLATEEARKLAAEFLKSAKLGGGKEDAAGLRQAKEAVSAYVEDLKMLAEAKQRVGEETKREQILNNIALGKYGQLTDALKKKILAEADAVDSTQKAFNEAQKLKQITEDYNKTVRDLNVDLAILAAQSELERQTLELTKSAYDGLTPAQKQNLAILREQIKATTDFQAEGKDYTKQIENLIKTEDKGKTVREKVVALMDEMTKKGHSLADATRAEWLERATAIDKSKAQEDAFKVLNDLMKDLGLETENATTYSQRLVAVLSNMDALKQMADALGISVENLRAKLEKAVSEKDRPTFLGQLEEKLKEMQKGLGSWSETWADSVIRGIEGIGDVFANAITQWDGTAQGFFKSLAAGFRSLILSIVAEITKMMVVNAVTRLLTALGMGAVSAGTVGATPGSSSIGHTTGQRVGLIGRAFGGLVSGAGTGTSDSIPAMLSNGEFVIPARIVKKFGVDFFESIRGGLMPRPAVAMAGGGLASMPSLGSVTNATTNNQNMSNVFNINVASGMGGGQTATMIQQEVLKGLTKVQKRNR